MTTVFVSLLQLVISAVVLGGGIAYLAHYVNEDRAPRGKRPERATAPALLAHQHS